MKTKAARAPTAKLDLYQTCKAEYVTPRTPVLLQLRNASYLAIAGTGAPGAEAFQQAIGALYSMAFTIKMASKFAGRDYAVCKLEALWWLASGRLFLTEPKEKWSWKLLIRTPDSDSQPYSPPACSVQSNALRSLGCFAVPLP